MSNYTHANSPATLPPDTPDPQLLSEIISGNPAAFELVFQRYEARIIRWARHYLTSEDLAYDVCQEVMIRLLKTPPSTLKEDSLSPWLCRVTRNIAIDRIRRNWREVLSDEEIQPRDDSYDPTQEIIAKDDADLLGLLLEELDEESRNVVKLRIYSELTFREIAAKLNIPLGTALWRMDNAIKQLRTQWKRLQS